MSVSLLRRLALAGDATAAPQRSQRVTDEEGAVVAHVVDILNTRQGSCLTCPDYGLIEISEVLGDFPDAIGLVQRTIKQSIALYEPRLRNVQVRHVKRDGPQELTLEFEISGQIAMSDGRVRQVRLATLVDASGNVRLST